MNKRATIQWILSILSFVSIIGFLYNDSLNDIEKYFRCGFALILGMFFTRSALKKSLLAQVDDDNIDDEIHNDSFSQPSLFDTEDGCVDQEQYQQQEHQEIKHTQIEDLQKIQDKQLENSNDEDIIQEAELNDNIVYKDDLQDDFDAYYNSNIIVAPPKEYKEVTLGNITRELVYDSQRDLYYISDDFKYLVKRSLEDVNMYIYNAGTIIDVTFPLFDIDNVILDFDTCGKDRACLQYHPLTKTGKQSKYPATVTVIQNNITCIMNYLLDATIGKLIICIFFENFNYQMKFTKCKNDLTIQKIEKKNKNGTQSQTLYPFIQQPYIKENSTIEFPDIPKSADLSSLTRQEYEDLLKSAVPYEIYSKSYTSLKSKKYPSDYVVFDTETTGLEYQIDKIIEIGAIKYVNHVPVDTFQMLINPERNFDGFIVKLTGITKEELKNKPNIKEVLPHFFEFIEDYTLIAHNAPFDVKMIACEAYRTDLPMFENKVIDTLTLAKRSIPRESIENYKLSTIKEYFGLSNKSHRALDDCETCSAIYQYYCNYVEKQGK